MQKYSQFCWCVVLYRLLLHHEKTRVLLTVINRSAAQQYCTALPVSPSLLILDGVSACNKLKRIVLNQIIVKVIFAWMHITRFQNSLHPFALKFYYKMCLPKTHHGNNLSVAVLMRDQQTIHCLTKYLTNFSVLCYLMRRTCLIVHGVKCKENK